MPQLHQISFVKYIMNIIGLVFTSLHSLFPNDVSAQNKWRGGKWFFLFKDLKRTLLPSPNYAKSTVFQNKNLPPPPPIPIAQPSPYTVSRILLRLAALIVVPNQCSRTSRVNNSKSVHLQNHNKDPIYNTRALFTKFARGIRLDASCARKFE